MAHRRPGACMQFSRAGTDPCRVSDDQRFLVLPAQPARGRNDEILVQRLDHFRQQNRCSRRARLWPDSIYALYGEPRFAKAVGAVSASGKCLRYSDPPDQNRLAMEVDCNCKTRPGCMECNFSSTLLEKRARLYVSRDLSDARREWQINGICVQRYDSQGPSR